MYCPNCGNKLSENSRFCNECGEAIERAEQNTPPVQTASPQAVAESAVSTKKKRSTASKIIIPLIVAAVGFVLGSKVIAPSILSPGEDSPSSSTAEEAPSNQKAYLNVYSSRDLTAHLDYTFTLGTEDEAYAKGIGDTIYDVYYTHTDGKILNMTIRIYEPLESASMEFIDDMNNLNCCTITYYNENTISSAVTGNGGQYRVATATFTDIHTDAAVNELYENGIIGDKSALTALSVEQELLSQGFIKR